MDHKLSWRWHELKENMLQNRDVQERQKLLLSKETLAMFEQPRREHRVHNFDERVEELIKDAASVLKLEQLNEHPSNLDFRKYVTKTHVFQWEEVKPSVFHNLDGAVVEETVKLLKKQLSETIRMECDIQRADMSPAEQKSHRLRSVIRCIADNLIIELGQHLNHLRTCHYDEDLAVRALWSRYGMQRKKRLYTYDPDDEEYETVDDQPVSVDCKFEAMVRSHLPLPEFVTRSEEALLNVKFPELLYKLSAYGEKEPCYELPTSILAGHRLGDPCEYGLVGILSTLSTHEIEEKYGAKVARDCRLAKGITQTFAWLVAQACNQGFNHVIELPYPLTSQTILTDGEKFSFLAYQLNTLELWKDNTANSRLNLCWYSQEMPLFHSIEDGKVRELNDDVLALLVKMFMVTPELRPYDMKPTVDTDSEPLHLKQDFVPEKVVVEEVIEEEKYIIE
ncbi:unnamed protein product [Candidula unifasciata]|uniref:Uncharacterized protein n=1 Tax=Candidula unifasciata TaxID=100452 RepID=A0A8S4A013_9EUPU|nr:unnamed protein product [Candidula unifasciata]